MLDLITAILEELFGVEKKPPPRRNVRPGEAGGDGSVSRRDASAPAREEPPPATLEDMLKRMFGMEEAKPPPPEPPSRPPRRAPVAPAPAPVAAKPVSIAEMVRRETPELTGTLTPASNVSAAVGGAAAAPAPASALPEFVARLRDNPAAAREAFVYAEIFGPPLADRREDFQ